MERSKENAFERNTNGILVTALIAASLGVAAMYCRHGRAENKCADKKQAVIDSTRRATANEILRPISLQYPTLVAHASFRDGVNRGVPMDTVYQITAQEMRLLQEKYCNASTSSFPAADTITNQ